MLRIEFIARILWWRLEASFSLGWSGTEPIITKVAYWPIIPAPDDDRWWWVWSNRWNAWQRKPKYSQKTCSNAAFSTTNAACLDPGPNPGRRSWKSATNGTARLEAWQQSQVSSELGWRTLHNGWLVTASSESLQSCSFMMIWWLIRTFVFLPGVCTHRNAIHPSFLSQTLWSCDQQSYVRLVGQIYSVWWKRR
jgi:hypothetical protein